VRPVFGDHRLVAKSPKGLAAAKWETEDRQGRASPTRVARRCQGWPCFVLGVGRLGCGVAVGDTWRSPVDGLATEQTRVSTGDLVASVAVARRHDPWLSCYAWFLRLEKDRAASVTSLAGGGAIGAWPLDGLLGQTLTWPGPSRPANVVCLPR
jgi:hypothetical protein